MELSFLRGLWSSFPLMFMTILSLFMPPEVLSTPTEPLGKMQQALPSGQK
jgi:hypothetical protein